MASPTRPSISARRLRQILKFPGFNIRMNVGAVRLQLHLINDYCDGVAAFSYLQRCIHADFAVHGHHHIRCLESRKTFLRHRDFKRT